MKSSAHREQDSPCKESTYLVVVTQQLVEEIDSLITDESLIVGVDKAVPGLLLEAAQNVIVLCIQFDLILVQVVKQIIGAEDLRNLDELV